jgi:hypothetical protein
MKCLAWFFLLALCSPILTHAQDSSSPEQMKGTICDSGCVLRQGDVATCQPTCAKPNGIAVFIDEHGAIRQILNQDVCKSHLGKQVDMTAVPEKPGIVPVVRQQEMWLHIQDLRDMPAQ